jgi:hypothetical protein
MSRYRTIEVDLSEWDDRDLIEEIEARGHQVVEDGNLPVETTYQLEERMMRALYRGEDMTDLVRQYLKLQGYVV